jgi:hypothetical protein
MNNPLRPHRSATGLTPFDAIAATLITIGLILIVVAMAGCSWHVAIDTWEGTASSDLDFHLNPAKATSTTTKHRPPRPPPTTTPVIPPPAPAK